MCQYSVCLGVGGGGCANRCARENCGTAAAAAGFQRAYVPKRDDSPAAKVATAARVLCSQPAVREVVDGCVGLLVLRLQHEQEGCRAARARQLSVAAGFAGRSAGPSLASSAGRRRKAASARKSTDRTSMPLRPYE